MATNQHDLWPTTIPTQVNLNAPVSILREQASLLEKKTNGLVTADVRSRKHSTVTMEAFWAGLANNPEAVLQFSFYLSAPALENYRYLLFWMIQPIEMYPLHIKDSPIGDVEVESEDEFIEALRKIFASEKTQRVIQAMIAQSLSTPTSDGVF